MRDRPARATVAGAAYLDLQNLARRQGRPTDELHQTYALECFLARLAASSHRDRLVLKGGVLLAAYDNRRPTRDVDLQARGVPNDVGTVLGVVSDIAEIHLDDGLTLDLTSVVAESIREADAYSGVRVSLVGELATARLAFHVDVNVGDPIWPAPREVALPRLLAGSIAVLGYPLSMIHAEKVVTAVQRGEANTRWRDFADIYQLASSHDIAGDELAGAVERVARYRRTRLEPLRVLLHGYAARTQARWAIWRRKQRLEGRLPERFGDVLDTVTNFADPVVEGEAAGRIWRSDRTTWTVSPEGRP